MRVSVFSRIVKTRFKSTVKRKNSPGGKSKSAIGILRELSINLAELVIGT